ncbi:hypothetical protein D3C74_260320 [compost metagenome]
MKQLDILFPADAAFRTYQHFRHVHFLILENCFSGKQQEIIQCLFRLVIAQRIRVLRSLDSSKSDPDIVSLFLSNSRAPLLQKPLGKLAQPSLIVRLKYDGHIPIKIAVDPRGLIALRLVQFIK